jgi:hypothetical protein
LSGTFRRLCARAEVVGERNQIRDYRGTKTKKPPIDGEVLEPEPTPRIHRVEITVHRRQRQQIPPWVIAAVIFAALCWISPFGMVVAIVVASVFLTMHPTIAIAMGVMLALVIIIAMRERLAGRAF